MIIGLDNNFFKSGCFTQVLLYLKINFLISQLKHVVGTQKNRLIETVLLSTKTNVGIHGKENLQFYIEKINTITITK